MATFRIDKNTTVAALKQQFSQEIGGVLRIYEGRSEASDQATLVSLGAKENEWRCRTSRTVGSFEKAFQDEFNLKVKVYTRDNWVKVLDDITLETASKLPNGMTKAKMEAYVSNYATPNRQPKEETTPTSPNQSNSVELPAEYKDMKFIEIKTKEIDLNTCDEDNKYEPGICIVSYFDEDPITWVCVNSYLRDAYEDAKEAIQSGEIQKQFFAKEYPVKVYEATEVIFYGFGEYEYDEYFNAIGYALNEFYNGGNKHYFQYSWDEYIDQKLIIKVDNDLFIANAEGLIEPIDLSDEQIEALKTNAIKSIIDDLIFSEDTDLAVIKLGCRYGLVNRACKLIMEQTFDDIGVIYKDGVIDVELNDKWGLINREGKVIIEPKFDSLGSFSDGLALAKFNDKWGIINKQGVFVLEPKFDDLCRSSDGLALAKINDKWGIINEQGDFVVEPKFDELDDFYEELAGAKINDKWGFINKQGVFVIEPKFDKLGRFHDGLSGAKINGKWGVIDKEGKFVVEPKYDGVDMYENDRYKNIVEITLDRKKGYVDLEQNLVVEPKFDRFDGFSEGLACVKINDKWGVINKQGDFVVEPKFDKMTENDGHYKVLINDKWGVIDGNGNWLVKATYDSKWDLPEL